MCGQINSSQSTLAVAAALTLLPTRCRGRTLVDKAHSADGCGGVAFSRRGALADHTTWWPRTVWRTQWNLDVETTTTGTLGGVELRC